MKDCSARSAKLNTWLDGELSPHDAASLAGHIATCPACAQHLRELADLRLMLTQLVVPQRAPAELRSVIEARLKSRRPPVQLGRRKIWASTGLVLAASLALAMFPRDHKTNELEAVRDAALRSNITDFAVLATPPSLSANGFRLAASRTDRVAGHNAVVQTYVAGDQSVTLCIWPANGESAHKPFYATYRNTAISYWNNGTNEFWAASLASAPMLNKFVRVYRSTS